MLTVHLSMTGKLRIQPPISRRAHTDFLLTYWRAQARLRNGQQIGQQIGTTDRTTKRTTKTQVRKGKEKLRALD